MVVIFLTLCILQTSWAQLVDEFKCPDQFEGYYPHLFSCDQYWKCKEGVASLETCGNGLAFDDSDPTFTTENCDYMHNIDCGNRTQFQEPISAPNCPRLYGIFSDEENCAAWYNCRNGVATRYTCAPGLAFDTKDRVCKWADQVQTCKDQVGQGNDENPVFICPKSTTRGVYSKHAHPHDCRQYFVCIGNNAREYGCPLGSVFKIDAAGGSDGKCADPKDVPECSNYYGDLKFDKQELVRAGVDPEAVGIKAEPGRVRVNRPSLGFNNLNRVRTSSNNNAPAPEVVRRKPTFESSELSDSLLESLLGGSPEELVEKEMKKEVPKVVNRFRPRPAVVPSVVSQPVQQPVEKPLGPSRIRNRPQSFSANKFVPSRKATTTTTTTTTRPTTTTTTTTTRRTTTTTTTESTTTSELFFEPSELPSFFEQSSPAPISVSSTFEPIFESSFVPIIEESSSQQPPAPVVSSAVPVSSTAAPVQPAILGSPLPTVPPSVDLSTSQQPAVVKAGDDYYYYYYYYDDEPVDGDAKLA